MRYLPSDKYNIAWFKLAECVARGERERALGLHRLLAHSLDDYAFATQLEGDILLAFDDPENALIKYYDALQLYKDSNKLIEAVAIGEHILILSAEKNKPLELLISLYELINIKQKLELHLVALFSLTLGKREFEKACIILEKLAGYSSQNQLKALREQLIISSMGKFLEPPSYIQKQIELFVATSLTSEDPHALSNFLEQLRAYNEYYFACAREHLNDANF